MNMKYASVIAGGLSVVTAIGLIVPSFMSHSEYNDNGTHVIKENDKAKLLGIENPEDYFLGVASQFSVFVRGDFTAEGSDCEGRIAAGGSANLNDELEFYSVGAKIKEQQPDVAHIVIGGSTLKNFEGDSLNIIAPLDAEISARLMEYNKNGNCKVYQGELFDFDEAFRFLEEQSTYASELENNVELIPDQYTPEMWTVVGTDEKLNVLELTGEQYDLFTTEGQYIDLTVQIPEGSYLIVNVAGNIVSLPSTEVKVQYTTGDMEELTGENLPILYNLYEAIEFRYSSSIQGSTLAPAANGSGDEGGHVSGLTVANSFKGGIQFGYSTFNPTKLEIGQKEEEVPTTEEPTTETTTATTTATTTEETTATTTEETTVTTTEETTVTTTEETTVTTTEETTVTTTEETTVTTTEETTVTTTEETTITTTEETTVTTTEETTVSTTEETTTIAIEAATENQTVTTTTTDDIIVGNNEIETTTDAVTDEITESETTADEETIIETVATEDTTEDVTTEESTTETSTTVSTESTTATTDTTTNEDSPKTGSNIPAILMTLVGVSATAVFASKKRAK